MARYKVVDLSPRFLAVDLEKQLLPGSFAHAVHRLLDHDFDLSNFDARYRNDDIRHNRRLNRFTLRGQKKVDTQWKLFCLVHSIEKLAHHGYGVSG